MRYVSAKDVKENKESFCIIDVREPYEFQKANIGSIHIPMADICSEIKQLPSDKTIVIMCQSGRRAEAVANLLAADYKMENVAVMEGGINAWKEQVDQTLCFD